MKKRIFAIMIMSTLLLSVFSIAPLALVSAEEKGVGGTLQVAVDTSKIMINPWADPWADILMVYGEVFSCLFSYDANSNIIGDLATSYEYSDDFRTVTITLRDDVNWHDGEKFNSEDVLFNFNHHMTIGNDPPLQSLYQKRLTPVESVVAVDDYTVQLNCLENTFLSPHSLVFPWGGTRMMPEHIFGGLTAQEIYDLGSTWQPVGTGPFKYVEGRQAEYHILEANLDWHGGFQGVDIGRPYLDKLVLKSIKEPQAVALALATGEVDVINDRLGAKISPTNIEVLEDAGMEVNKKLGSAVVNLVFNNRTEATDKYPWLTDPNVKLALAHAIDREAIIDGVLAGLTSSNWGPVAQKFGIYVIPDLVPPEFNPALAEQMLDDAGYPKDANGVRFTLEMGVNADGLYPDVAEVIKDFWRQIGVETALFIPDVATWIEVYEYGPDGFQDLACGLKRGGTGPDSPQSLANIYHSSKVGGAGENPNWFIDARVDELLDLAQSTPIIETQQEAVWEASQYIIDSANYIWLYQSYELEIINPVFQGFELSNPVGKRYGDYGAIYDTRITPPDVDGDGDGTDGDGDGTDGDGTDGDGDGDGTDGDGDGTDGDGMDGDGDDYEGREGAVFPWLEVGIAAIVIIIIAVAGLLFFGRKK
jgi:peptide/nickel transport system substrate-binding protein